METLKKIQGQNEDFFITEEYEVLVNVYQKENGSVNPDVIISKCFFDINDVKVYVKENDNINTHFEIRAEKDIVLDGLHYDALNFEKTKASVDVCLSGFQLHVNTNATISVNRLDGCRLGENTKGSFISGVSNVKIAKGKTISIFAQDADGEAERVEVSYVNFECENGDIILGKIQKNTRTDFYKVCFESSLKKLDIYGSFYYIKPGKSEDRCVEITDTLTVFNRDGEAVIYGSLKVNKVVLDGNMSVWDLQCLADFCVTNISKYCILSGGKAELTNVKIRNIRKDNNISFLVAMEQSVSLENYKDYFANDWEEVFDCQDGFQAENYFEDVKLLSARGILEISGKITYTENRIIPIMLEKRYTWEVLKQDGSGKEVFSYPVNFLKETPMEKGETIAIIPKSAVNYFSVRDKDTCLKQYKNKVKVVASSVIVLREGTHYKVEYTSLKEAATNLKTDFNIRKKETGNFIFIFKTDHILTGNVVFPKFVKKLQFVTEQTKNKKGCIVKRLDLNGFSLSVSGFLNLNAGLEIVSQRKTSIINLTGKQGETGFQIFIGENYIHTSKRNYDARNFCPIQNVNILSANGTVVMGGKIPGRIEGTIYAYECVIDSNLWKVNEITTAKLFVCSSREEKVNEKDAEFYEEGRLESNKIDVSGKFVIEQTQKKELFSEEIKEDKVKCNTLITKNLEMYNGLVHVEKSAKITDLFLFYDNPTLLVEGSTFHIKGKILCGALNARLITSLKENKKTANKEEPALQVDGDVKLIQDERYGIAGDKITISILDNHKNSDSSRHMNMLLKARKASETVFQSEQAIKDDGDKENTDTENYILRKTENFVEVFCSDEVAVALYKKGAEESLINHYADINEAFETIDHIKDKEADYVLWLIKDIGSEECKVNFKLSQYANSITILSKEYHTIFCNKPLVQKSNIILKNVRLKSDSAYLSGKYKLVLINSTLETDALKLQDLRIINSDITISGNASLGNVFLEKNTDVYNTSMITAIKMLKVDNIIGEGKLTVYHAYTDKDWKKAVSQMKVKGEIFEDITLDLRPCFYDKYKNVYTTFLNVEGVFDEQNYGRQSEELMVKGNQAPEEYQKIFTAKNISFCNPIYYYGMSHEKVWPMKYKDGVYFTNQKAEDSNTEIVDMNQIIVKQTKESIVKSNLQFEPMGKKDKSKRINKLFKKKEKNKLGEIKKEKIVKRPKLKKRK